MEIFNRLLFGHLLADFTFQSNYIAEWKRKSFVGLFVHVAIHPVCYYALTWNYLDRVWISPGGVNINGWWAIALMALLHFIEDWFRISRVKHSWRDNTLFYLWDQGVHIGLIWLVAFRTGLPATTLWPCLGSLFVIVTHFSTVTVWFVEKDIYGRDYPPTEEKYISILQRLVVWLAFFLPDPWWMIVTLFVLVSFGRHIWKKRVDFTWTSVLLGNLIAILCGVVARFGLHAHL